MCTGAELAVVAGAVSTGAQAGGTLSAGKAENQALQAAGQAEHEGDMHEIRGGDVLFIEPNTVHQFVNTGSEPLSFICMVPIAFDCGDGRTAPTPGSD